MKLINFHDPKKINNNKRKLNINKNIYSAEFDHFKNNFLMQKLYILMSHTSLVAS